MNPENREVDYRRMLSVCNTELLDRQKFELLVEKGSKLPFTVTNNFSLYYGGMYHDDMVRDEHDIMMEGYFRFVDGKVWVSTGIHHKKINNDELEKAVEDLLLRDIVKCLNRNQE